MKCKKYVSIYMFIHIRWKKNRRQTGREGVERKENKNKSMGACVVGYGPGYKQYSLN